MGRYINSKINGEYEFVWKYGFGAQSSEMYRIHEELELGKYHRLNDYKDVLILNQKDTEELAEWLGLLKESCKTKGDEWFVAMVEAIYKFMVLHSDQDEIVFEGEF